MPQPAEGRRLRVATVVVVAAAVAVAAFFLLPWARSGRAVRSGFALARTVDVLPPSERDVLEGPLQDIVGELKRLDILSADADLESLAGVEAQVDDLELSSQRIRDGLAEVRIDRGTLTTSADPNRLPLGGFVRDVGGDDLSQARPTGPEEEDLRSDGADDVMIAVREDDRWYFSVWYTVAELARRESDAPLPDPAQRVNANGAGSAEEAVDRFLRAAVSLDLRRMIELLPPDEARALHDYAPLFLDDAQDAGADLRRSVDVDITRLDLRTAGQGDDRALVQIERLAFDAEIREENLRITYRDGCATLAPLTGRGRPERFCPGDFGEGAPELFDQFLPEGVDAPQLDVAQPALGLATVRSDGKWYVSPTRTVLDNVLATLKVLDRDDLRALRDLSEEFE